ncbi:hypothetical protein EVAR_17026_1 [Eumeta japonica]|uniref:Uncharacterized protein n=1 Tax=Eumeta variegata TaxID=151549 RepID=A0A4C1V5B5_EUMVA|nr:hypothetical protein EVAR_17026_1 [Eumeta japonica]
MKRAAGGARTGHVNISWRRRLPVILRKCILFVRARVDRTMPANAEVPASASSVLLVHLGAVGVMASGAALCGGGAAGGGCACGALLHALHPLQLWTVCGLHADRAAAIAAPLHYAAIVSARKASIH